MQLNRSIIFVLMLLLVTIAHSYAQVPGAQRERLKNLIYKINRIDSLPDSTAIYSCHININILKANNYKPIIESSDSSFTNKIHDLNLLKDYDYKPLMGKSNGLRLVIPIVFITIGFKDRPNALVRADVLARKIDDIFFKQGSNDRNLPTEYLEPFILTIENFQYN